MTHGCGSRKTFSARIISRNNWSVSGTSGPAREEFYQKITDIYSQCSADYDVESPITKEFFATVQNKLHYAVTHHTAAEIVYGRADSTKPNMGLTTWKNAPKGRIRKSDVIVAKNYLNETEMRNLNEIVTMYLGLCGTAGPPGKCHVYGRLGQTA